MTRRSKAYLDGYRAASKDAVAFLGREASEMNDPQAKRCWDSASFRVGVHLKQKWLRMSGLERDEE